MENSEKTQILEAKKAFCSAKNISNNKLSILTGISTSYLSQIDNGQWDNPSEEVWVRLWNMVKPFNHSFKVASIDNFKKINVICDYSLKESQIAVVMGFAGAGKTTALSYYYQKNAYVYMVSYEKLGAKVFFSDLAKQLGIEPIGSTAKIVISIIEALQGIRKGLILIDEASDIWKDATILRHLRTIRNKTLDNIGFVFAGVGYMKTNIDKLLKKNKIGIPEFCSRVGTWNVLNEVERIDLEAICKANNLQINEVEKHFGKIDNYRTLNVNIRKLKK